MNLLGAGWVVVVLAVVGGGGGGCVVTVTVSFFAVVSTWACDCWASKKIQAIVDITPEALF